MTFLASAALLLPAATPIDDAAVGGTWRGAAQLPGSSPAEMAVEVGQAALAASSVPRDDVRWTLHAGSGYQGPMGWPVHHHVRDGIVGDAGNALEIKQYCSAGLTTWLVANGLLASDHGGAVCTGADNWSWGDRFTTSRSLGGEPFSDVAHAAVLSGADGFAEIMGCGTASRPGQAEVWRTRPAFWEPASLEDYREAYRRARDASSADGARESLRMLARATRSALTGAQISSQYVTHFVPHGSGGGEPYRTLANKLGLPWSEASHEHQLGQGYLGVSTQVAGLIHCAKTGLTADSIVLLLGAEYQLSATAIVLGIRRVPHLQTDGDIEVLA